MKKLLALALIATLAGCVVAPLPQGRVVVQPSVEISYIWDPVRIQYYYVDRGHKHYQPRGWHDRKHPHGGPPGQNKKRDRDHDRKH